MLLPPQSLAKAGTLPYSSKSEPFRSMLQNARDPCHTSDMSGYENDAAKISGTESGNGERN